MGAVENAKNVGGTALGIIAILAFMAIPVAFLYGAASVSVWALEYLPTIFGWTLTIALLLLTPLALAPPLRGISGNGFVLVSYVFGLILWLFALAYTYMEWGLVPVIIGILLAGVGIVPIAFVLTIFDAAWGVLGNIFILIVLTFASRGFGFWLIEKAADRQFAIDAERARKEVAFPATRID